MKLRWQFRCYQRPIQPPLQTGHGVWSTREGIILRFQAVEASEQTPAPPKPSLGKSFGEIAPIPWFGSETLAEALALCQALPPVLTWADIAAIPETLPACQFGFASAWHNLSTAPANNAAQFSFSGLLPTGVAALDAWEPLWQQGYRTFKWKIGVAPVAQEIALYQQLNQVLPPEAKLRLDANGSLDSHRLQAWFQVLSPTRIEFIEQPLPVDQFAVMQALSCSAPVPLALDESVANFAQLQVCYAQGWRGIYVIKPAIFGFPRRLEQFCQTHAVDVVFSSALETAIGRQAGLQLAQRIFAQKLVYPERALGYGVNHWLAQAEVGISECEQFWQGLERPSSHG
jgi:o-succinylbenzoate synthase